ncbi:MAG TPA: DUF4912 domain-containing protein [Clostridiaceae bacterium]|nr:DUF4912 domain-containing protein [Clostridiaceae bacterium]
MEESQKGNNNLLPELYNDDIMILYAVDPKRLFTCWEISEIRKNHFINDFGRELWEKSVPVLIVSNITRNESFEIRVNNFSDSWYINVPHSDCIYRVELGRRVSEHFVINLITSNSVYVPGDGSSSDTKILFADYRDISGTGFYEELNSDDIGPSFSFSFDIEDTLSPSSYGIKNEDTK